MLTVAPTIPQIGGPHRPEPSSASRGRDGAASKPNSNAAAQDPLWYLLRAAERLADLDDEWRGDALCANPTVETSAFFPSRGERAPDWVFAMCTSCPVKGPCLAYAIATNSQGVWAGTTEGQRRRMRRQRRAA